MLIFKNAADSSFSTFFRLVEIFALWKFWVYFDNGNRSNGKFIKLKNGEFDVCVFQVKLGLVGVILGVSRKEMGVGEKLRVRQQTG